MKNLSEVTEFDEKCLKKALCVAKESLNKGNYPVGAVLAINDEIIGVGGNEINQKKSFVNHAENLLIIEYGKKLAEIRNDNNKMSTLYTTLEPCIQCLGASVTNHIDRIIFIEKDPNGGACNLKHDNIGLWYKEFWPEIIQYKKSDEVKNLMIKFFKDTIREGDKNKVIWAKRMIKLFN